MFAIGVFLVWWVYRKHDIVSIIEDIKKAQYSWILLSFVFALISHFARALRWNILINSLGHKTKPHTTFYAIMIGYMANVIVPRLGEVSRCGVLHKKDKIPFNSLLGTVLSERVFDLIVLLFLIFLVIVFQLQMVGGFVSNLMQKVLYTEDGNGFSSYIYFIGVFILFVCVLYFFVKIYKNKLQKLTVFEKIRNFKNGFTTGFTTILKLEKKGLFFFYTFIIWFMYFLMTYVVFFAMKETENLRWIDGLTILAIGSLGMVVPLPGGFGSYHFVVKGLLVELYMVPDKVSAAWAGLIHTSQTLMILVVGLISYFIIISLRKKSDKIDALSE